MGEELNPIVTASAGGYIIGGVGGDQQGSGAARGGGGDPLAFDPGNQDPLENVGVDPLGGGGEGHHHHHHETEEEPLIHFEGIKSEEVYLNEGSEDEEGDGDYDTSDQGDNSGLGEGEIYSGFGRNWK
jgi:hypothetical protein